MIEPPNWPSEKLDADRNQAILLFRKHRLEEPLEHYLEAFDRYHMYMEDLLKLTADLSQLETSALSVLTDRRLLEAFRYLAAPPISQDDLKILAEVPSLSSGRLKKTPEDVRRLLGVVKVVLDHRRFAWVVEGREPTEGERNAAVVASAALMAASRVQTGRRTFGKNQQEGIVIAALKKLNWTVVPARNIPNLAHAPGVGEFCGESRLGKRKADIVVRLWDQRVMPIECKVSNSSLNSVKRLNNDAAAKAVVWRSDFGRLNIVPSAVLSGVYKLSHLLEAQERGLAIFWAHDMKPLTDWLASTKS